MAKEKTPIITTVVSLPFILLISIIEIVIRLVFVLPIVLTYMVMGKDAIKKGENFLRSFSLTKSFIKLFGGN